MEFNLIPARYKQKLLVGLFLSFMIVLASCNQEAIPVEQRLIILGFDGMDPVLTQQWMDNGSLPNSKKLASMGGFHTLPTSNPPISTLRHLWCAFSAQADATTRPMIENEWLFRDIKFR